MKKLLFCLVGVLLLFSLTMGACTKTETSTATSTTTQVSTVTTTKVWPASVSLSGPGGEGYPSYMLMAGLGMIIQKHLDVSTRIQTTMGFDAHLLFKSDQIQIAMLGTTSGPMCLMGTGPAAETGAAPYRAILGYTTTTMDTIVLDRSGIKTFKDLEGNTVGIGPKAIPFIQTAWDDLVEAYGLDADSITLAWYDSPGEAYDALKAGTFDAVFGVAEHPSADYIELFSSFPGRLLDHTEPYLTNLLAIADVGMNVPSMIPGGTYSTMPNDYHTFGGGSFISAQAYLSDDFVYEVVKSAFKYQDEWTDVHGSAIEINADKVNVLLNFCLFHPGAIKYYKEIGIWTSAMDQKQADWLTKIPPEAQYP